jgi:protein-S-isoprenylcysteine O-methyltransferase Ste14
LVVAAAALWQQVSSGQLSTGKGAFTALHQLLRFAFYVLMIGLLVGRKPSRSSAPARRAAIAAYAGTFAPFLLVLQGRSGNASEALTAVAIGITSLGLALSVYALGWLGRSFGVVPQARELVRSGPYRYVRHPLYVAELVTFVGSVLTMISPFSTVVLVGFVTIQAYRAMQEEKVLKAAFPEYESYMSQAGRFTPRLQTLSRAA